MRRRTGTARLVGAVAVALSMLPAALSPAIAAYPRPMAFERVDIAVDGSEGEDSNTISHISAMSNGRFVAFESEEPLDSADVNQFQDIYLRDVAQSMTELITRDPSGLPAVGPPDANPLSLRALSRHPAITPDGRFVAFDSAAVNLVPGDTNGLRDVFVFDRKNGVMERVSVDSEGEQAEGVPLLTASFGPSLSRNGRYVSFTSNADNLVDDDTNDGPDIFVRDRKAGTTVRASVDSDGNEVETCQRLGPDGELPNLTCLIFSGAIAFSSINATGRYVAFDSRASDLVEDDTNRTWDVFVHDLKTKKTERMSVASDGNEARDPLGPPYQGWAGSLLSGFSATKPGHSLSASGRYVVFASLAGNLVPNDTNRTGKQPIFPGGQDVFVHDRNTGRTERISVTSHGGELHLPTNSLGEVGSDKPSIDANGRYVGFHCACWESGAPRIDLAVYDRHAGALIDTVGPDNHRDPRENKRGFWNDLSPSGRFMSFTWASDGSGFWRVDMGKTLSVGELAASGQARGLSLDGVPGFARTGSAWIDDAASDAISSKLGAVGDLLGARIIYRPTLNDIFVVLELEHMPRTPKLAVVTAGSVYGMSFELDGRPYEIRSASTGLGASGETTADFGLFSCTDGGLLCTKVADLEGGFGTTGERITTAVPLDDLGVRDGSVISEVKAFTALGTFLGGPTTDVDGANL